MKLTLLLLVGFLAAPAEPPKLRNYKAAMEAHSGNAVVLLVQDGCAPCQKLENNLLPALREAGVLNDSSIIVISVQKQPDLVHQLQGSEMNQRRGFPVLVVFRQKGRSQWGWRRFGYTSQVELITWLSGIKKWQPPE